VDECRVKAAAEQPDDIREYRQAAHAAIGGHHSFAKGPEHEAGQFETLQTEGYAYEGEAQYKPAKDIAQRGGQTAKDQPEDVADEIHVLKVEKFSYWGSKMGNVTGAWRATI
jgi:hypothetical protein